MAKLDIWVLLLLVPVQVCYSFVRMASPTAQLLVKLRRGGNDEERLAVVEQRVEDLRNDMKEQQNASTNMEASLKILKASLDAIALQNDKLSKEIKDGNEKMSKEIKDVNEKVSKEIKDVSKEIKDVSKEIKDVSKEMSDRFALLYIFLAVLSTALGMANFKDFVAFFK